MLGEGCSHRRVLCVLYPRTQEGGQGGTGLSQVHGEVKLSRNRRFPERCGETDSPRKASRVAKGLGVMASPHVMPVALYKAWSKERGRSPVEPRPRP